MEFIYLVFRVLVYDEWDVGQRVMETQKDGSKDDLKLVGYPTWLDTVSVSPEQLAYSLDSSDSKPLDGL